MVTTMLQTNTNTDTVPTTTTITTMMSITHPPIHTTTIPLSLPSHVNVARYFPVWPWEEMERDRDMGEGNIERENR